MLSSFLNNQEEQISDLVWNAEALGILLYKLCPKEHDNFKYSYPSSPVNEKDAQ